MSLAALAVLAPTRADAQPRDDGYCDYVEGVAGATAAPLFMPELFAWFGYIEQPSFSVTPMGDPSNLRVLGGARYSVTNIFAGRAIKSRASAECRRHQAGQRLRGAPTARALAARLRVYEQAQAEADKMLQDITADLDAKRATTPEATATRLRVEELRGRAARTRTALAALPAPDQQLGTLLTAYRTADADMEASDGTLRKVNAYDVSVRVGVERYLEGANKETDYFALLQLSVNISALWIGGHNDRAAAGRSRFARSGQDVVAANTTVEHLRGTLDLEAKRAEQLTVMIADLERQREALATLGGEQTKRFRDTLWFDVIEAKAELAHTQAYVEALREVLGPDAR